MAENIKKWYVVRAVSGQENKVKNYIFDRQTKLTTKKTAFRLNRPSYKYMLKKDLLHSSNQCKNLL